MRFRAVAFDIDGTLVEPVSSWRYLHERLGKWDVLAEEYERRFLAGEIDYRTFCELDAKHWKGLSDAYVRSLFSGVRYRMNVEQMAGGLRAAGLMLIGISTGLQYLAERVLAELKFDRVVSNRLVVEDGILTGGVEIVVSHDGKGEALKEILRETGTSPDEVIAVGDGRGDVPLAAMCGYAIACRHADKELVRCADYLCKTNDAREVLHHICECLAG